MTYNLDCKKDAVAALGSFYAAVRYGGLDSALAPDDPLQVEMDNKYKALAEVETCGLTARATCAARAAQAARQAENRKGAQSAAAADAARKAADQQTAADEARLKAEDSALTDKVCAPSCRLEDYDKQIQDYADAIQAIVSGSSVRISRTASKKGNAAIDDLLKATKQDALATAVSDAVFTVGGLYLQAERHNALRTLTLRFTRIWPQVAPFVIRAARMRQAEIILYRSDAARRAADTATDYDQRHVAVRSPVERLQLFELLDPKSDAASKGFRDSVKTDPATGLQRSLRGLSRTGARPGRSHPAV